MRADSDPYHCCGEYVIGEEEREGEGLDPDAALRRTHDVVSDSQGSVDTSRDRTYVDRKDDVERVVGS